MNRSDGVVSLNGFEGKAKTWDKKLVLGEEDLDETVKRVLEKVSAAKAAKNK